MAPTESIRRNSRPLELACFSRLGRVLASSGDRPAEKLVQLGQKHFWPIKKKEPRYNAGLEVLRGIGGLVPRLSESAPCREIGRAHV